MQNQNSADRIATLDTIRGVAVMGILLMNIVTFAMPEAAYMNPRAYGGHTGANLGIWAFNFIFFDGKMRGLFSFLFGASTLLVAQAAVNAGRSAVRTHYARMAWLFVFGFLHLWLIWSGDVLAHYAIVGSLAFLFRQLPPYKLVVAALMLILLQAAIYVEMSLSVHALAAQIQTGHPSADALSQWVALRTNFGAPPAAEIASDLASFRGSWFVRISHGLGAAIASIPITLMLFAMETLSSMLLGMAAFKSGMLTGAWARADYRRWVAIGFGVGVPGYALLAWWMVASNFDMQSVSAGEMTLSAPLRPLMILAWASLIVLLARPGGWLSDRIAAAGRMAFTNYLMTSLLCSTLFYGQGFALFGDFSRIQIYPVVIVIWALMLFWSKPWLGRFAYGPFEWLWRSLARGAPQPMRRRYHAR